MSDEKHVFSWRTWVTREEEQLLRRFERACMRYDKSPVAELAPMMRQWLAENAETVGKLHLLTTVELQDEIERRFGFRIDRDTLYYKRKTWAIGMDYFKFMRGRKADFVYNVDKVWPRLMNHLKKHGREDTLEKLKDPALTAIPRRKRGSVIHEQLPKEVEAEILENFRPLGQIANKGGWD